MVKPRTKKFFVFFLALTILAINESWGKTNSHHLLGLHWGITTGGGLFYRNYANTNFAWQVSFFPMYQRHFLSSDDASKNTLLLLVGNFEQWFLHFTRLHASGMKGMLFLWGGGSLAYEYTQIPSTETSEKLFRFTLGGGPGFEMVFYEHFVTTLAVGYATTFDTKKEVMMGFTFEVSAGYKF
ncbi:MAG: hypothetical protein N2314_05050 [Brevinematales bacterium]|nr:hypothetical protein [Brevinematales bacterium]